MTSPTTTRAANQQSDLVGGLEGSSRWSSGNYAVVGTTLQIVGEDLCEALDVRSGQKVLDVAAGNGNVTLAAARRWCNVVSTDYVPSLLEDSRTRAAAEGLSVEYGYADAEDLSFADATFDVVVSTFGVMFTPTRRAMNFSGHARAAARLASPIGRRRVSPGRSSRQCQYDIAASQWPVFSNPSSSNRRTRRCRQPAKDRLEENSG
jgi:SAM-dependent methyltransferase